MLSNADCLIHRLNDAGFEAFAVGGCVRDRLLGQRAYDVDITTSASPSEVQAVFSEFKTIPTGIQHGTVTVIYDGAPYEITTYRIDGCYSDGRHPDRVSFGGTLQEDLSRRDFTVNAIAYHPDRGLIDPFGGIDDLRAKTLRCVGDPVKRFSEDALRIVRLIRFMSVLGFQADKQTADAAHLLCERLSLVSAERKQAELLKMVCGENFPATAMTFSDVLCRILLPLAPCVGLDQRNPHHDFDVYTHMVRAVGYAPNDPIVRLAVLLHDVGKPICMHTDENGIGHFYVHAAVGADIVHEALRELRFDNTTVRDVTTLVRYHDISFPADRKILKRRLSRFGERNVQRLLAVKTADASACREGVAPADLEEVYALLEEIQAAENCFDLRSLQLSGRDLLALGYPSGALIGTILQAALDAVLDERLNNDREELLAFVKEGWPL